MPKRIDLIRLAIFVGASLALSIAAQTIGLRLKVSAPDGGFDLEGAAVVCVVLLGSWFAADRLTSRIVTRFWPDEGSDVDEDPDVDDADVHVALATVAPGGIWDWFIPIYFRLYVRFMALGVLMFGALILFAFLAFRYGHLVGDGVKPPDERALPIVFLVPFFSPFAWLALGYSEIFASERRQAPHGLFWRFNILNGTILWGALWLLGFAGSLVVPAPHSMPGGEALLSLVVSLPMLIGMSALAASTSFANSWLRSWMR